jgi:hypothetical protein
LQADDRNVVRHSTRSSEGKGSFRLERRRGVETERGLDATCSLSAVFFLVGFNPLLGEVRIEASTGGEVSHYLELFAVLRQSGERIVIDGPCYSACTLVLSTMPHRVCVARRAILGFHAPRLVDDYG